MPYQRNQTQTPEAATRASTSTSRQPPSPTYDSGPTLLQLHSMIGNRAVGRMLQAKLKVNEPGDEYEREADAVAEQVLRMPEAPHLSPASPNGVQRKCAACAGGNGACPKCAEAEKRMVQRKSLAPRITPMIRRQAMPAREENEEDLLQAKETSGERPAVSPSIEDQINGLRSNGQPLSPSVRAFFEPRLGRNFSGVRVHTDSRAADSARAVNARAYTLGRDVVFGAGQYAPETTEGRRLLGHELTHVVQQTGCMVTRQIQTIHDGDSKRKPGAPPKAGAGHGMASTPTVQAPTLQRQIPISGVGETLVGKALLRAWLSLPKAIKVTVIDKAIDAALALVDEFPGKPLFGEMWTFMKEGLIGFYGKLKSATEEIKIRVIDKIATIMAGESTAFTLAYLKGLVKGFFIDGALGIFIAIWDLIKGLKGLWDFIKGIGEAIAGFPEDIQRLIQDFQSFGEELAANCGPAIEEIKKLVTDPNETGALLTLIVEKGKAVAKQAGEKIADALLNFFSKPGAEAAVGETAGNVAGQVLWEVVFAVVTAGGGVAVTAAKETFKFAAKILGKIVGKIVGSILKVVEEIRLIFGKVAELVKGAVKFVKGKLAELGGQFGKLLDHIGEFFAKLLRNCHESKLVCKFVVLVKKIAGTVGLNHSFDEHAAQWFGRVVNKGTHLSKWQELIERAAKSKNVFEWTLRNDETICHLAHFVGDVGGVTLHQPKPFAVFFFKSGPRAGELATAFVPNPDQLARMLALLGKTR